MTVEDNSPAFAGVVRDTLSDRVYRELRDAIVTGRLKPGAELNQVAIARDLDVSRVPVREALHRLGAERLVENRPHQRYTVIQTTPDSLAELLDLRTTLEVFGCQRLLQGDVAPILGTLREVIAQMSPSDIPAEQWLTLDRRFHATLCGQGSETSLIVENIRDRVQRSLHAVAGAGARRRNAQKEHQSILRAISDGDVAAAEKHIRSHIAATAGVVVSSLVSDTQV